MDTTYGPAAPALSGLTKVIREYSLFQAVLLVIDRLREAHPYLSEDDLYDQVEFQANPSLGFPRSDVDRVEFFEEHGQMRARMRFNLIGLVGSGSPLPAFYAKPASLEEMVDQSVGRALDLFGLSWTPVKRWGLDLKPLSGEA